MKVELAVSALLPLVEAWKVELAVFAVLPLMEALQHFHDRRVEVNSESCSGQNGGSKVGRWN